MQIAKPFWQRAGYLTQPMGLSLAVGVFMLGAKLWAYWLTGSMAILSDASESVVHVLAVSFAAYSLWVSRRPPDRSHNYGHEKIAFFSAGVEGSLIVLAAGYVTIAAIERWIQGAKPENLGAGAVLILAAGIVNAALGAYLLKAGRKFSSLILEADGKHVLTDSWTSLGVIGALGLIHFTGWAGWDPLVAMLVALNIVWSGQKLVRRSVGGLMDEADSRTEARLEELLSRAASDYHVGFHGLRYRNAGNTLWIEFHLLFPRGTPLESAHSVATSIEETLQQEMGGRAEVTTHLETLEDHDQAHAHAHLKQFSQ